MRATTILLSATWVTTLTVLAAACSGGGSKGSARTLRAGAYDFVAGETLSDACWPDLAVFPPIGIAFQYQVAVGSSSGNGSVTLTPPSSLAPILSAVTGTRTGNAIATTGASTVIVSSGCSLIVSALGVGEMTAPDTFDIDFTATINGDTTASNGEASKCAAFQDTSFQMIPFPRLSPSTNGTCSYALRGTMQRL